MKITFVKFFQYVDVPQGTYDKFEPRTSVNNLHHTLTLDGNLLTIVHNMSGSKVIANLYNISYFRVAEDDKVDAKPAPSAKGNTKTKQESN